MNADTFWRPPDFTRPNTGRPGEIMALFTALFPVDRHGDLAEAIGRYWLSRLGDTWKRKPAATRAKDMRYRPGDPLGRVAQHTVVIAYADSVYQKPHASLAVLDRFLKARFPAVGGLHVLPACEIAEHRFNDGGFSQIRRDRIHPPYGSNPQFAAMMSGYFSMADMVLNHVDCEHPRFRAYLDGDDRSGDCFFVFSEAEYRRRQADGDFAQIFRPRPFPLFTIFRRKPVGSLAGEPRDRRMALLNRRFCDAGLAELPAAVINLLIIFGKLKNDQMLLDADYQHVTDFMAYCANRLRIDPASIFTVSRTQETRHVPYVFSAAIGNVADVLALVVPQLGRPAHTAPDYARIFAAHEAELFGAPIRALTTFSHVQVDLNTATFQGLKLLIDDFSWYLQMDLNMLRLDAANFAFKRWRTTCFGLPEVRKLLKILFVSMDCVAPRIVPNLEVNAPLSAVLAQMADPQAPPPMMYDFHLASMLPLVFNTADVRPLAGIFDMISRFEIPGDSIRFSLDESHDGKSVSGSGGVDRLLTYAQRRELIETVVENGGYVKTKSCPRHRYPADVFEGICIESGLDAAAARRALFDDSRTDGNQLYLKSTVSDSTDVARALKIDPDQLCKDAALSAFVEKIFEGKEPYELCATTADSLRRLEDPVAVVKRYLAFKTLAFALMGRNVKATFINDLMGLGNDHARVKATGELRNIKRTKSERSALEQRLDNPAVPEHWIALHMNNLVALVDADPALHPRSTEARFFADAARPGVAMICNGWQKHRTLVIVNAGAGSDVLSMRPDDYGLDGRRPLFDNLTGAPLGTATDRGAVRLPIGPFARFWIKNETIPIDRRLQMAVGSEAEMAAALNAGGNDRTEIER